MENIIGRVVKSHFDNSETEVRITDAGRDELVAASFYLLDRALNCYDEVCVAEHLFYELTHTHRTLQQNFWRMMVRLIRDYAEIEHCDPRNRGSVDLCHFLSKALEKEKEGYLPYI